MALLGLTIIYILSGSIAPLVAAIPTVAQRNYTNGLQFKPVFSRFSWMEPILTLYRLAMKECVYECQIRPECEAVNYWTVRQECGLLPMDTADLDRAPAGIPCAYVRKANVTESPLYNLTSLCPVPCGMDKVCDPGTGICKLIECRPHYQHNASVTGNILSVGSRILVACKKWYLPSSFPSWCHSSGNWSNIVQCYYQFECQIPPYFPNAVPSYATYEYKEEIPENLAVRYSCNSHYKAPRAHNDMTIQCNGTANSTYEPYWEEPEFICIYNCYRPPLIENATSSRGENLENMTKTYTCKPGYLLSNDSYWDKETIVLNTTCIHEDGWTDTHFQCDPVCGTPPEIIHGYQTELTNDGGSMFLVYTCRRTIDTVYTMAAPYTDTDTKVECLNGTWANPYFHCVADCSEPLEGSNVTANAILTGSGTLEGAVRSYTCDPGLVPDGNCTTTCQSSGNWTDVNFVCVPVCEVPPPLANAWYIYDDSNSSVSVARYSCLSGYGLATPTGEIELTCVHPAGPWSASNETCLTDCYEPPSIANAVASPGATLDGTTRNYTCIPGYFLNDTQLTWTTCQSDGTWTAADVLCIEATDCSEPLPGANITANATLESGGTLEGAVRSYTCDPGLVPDGNYTTTCQSSGNWTDVNFVCVPVCDMPPLAPHLDVQAFLSDPSVSTATVACVAGFSFPSAAAPIAVTCSSPGPWSGPSEDCLIECPDPPPYIGNMTVSSGGYLEGATRNYSCLPGYTSNHTGPMSITCQSDGSWTAGDFTCESICDQPPLVPNMDVQAFSPDPTTSTATVACASGFSFPSFAPNVAVTCSSPGPWTSPSEDCLIVFQGTRTNPSGGGKKCPDPPSAIENMTVSSGGYLEGATRDYSCLPGYTSNHTGPMSITCQSDGTWTDGNFTCEPKQCPVGWSKFEGFCYFLDDSVSFATNVIDVVTYCHTNVYPNSYMLQVETAAKQTMVQQMLQGRTSPDSNWCLGLHSAARDNVWVWSGTGEALSYSNWASTQGDDNQEFVRMDDSTYEWQDVNTFPCTPVCEIP